MTCSVSMSGSTMSGSMTTILSSASVAGSSGSGSAAFFFDFGRMVLVLVNADHGDQREVSNEDMAQARLRVGIVRPQLAGSHFHCFSPIR